MSPRNANIVWLRDVIEHLAESQKQLEWADDPEAVRLLTEAMLRDLDCCRRLCESLRRRAAPALVA
jgi:hypothetical protein